MRLPHTLSPLQAASTSFLAGTVSGLLYWGCIPPTGILPFTWICLVPCLIVCYYLPTRWLIVSALLAGVVSGLGRVYWIADTLVLYGDVPTSAAVATNGLLIVYLALYWICFCLICTRLDQESPFFPWLAASAWIVLEWMQSWVISGFPWALIGYSLHGTSLLLQSASIAGIYGLSFLVVLVNATIAQCIVERTRSARILLPPVLLIAAALIFGSYRWNVLADEETSTLKVGIVQGNVTQDEKWKPGYLDRTVSRYADLTRELASSSRFDLIVFPETALPMYFNDPAYEKYARAVAALARELRTPLLVGSLEGSRLDPTAGIYNRAFLLDIQGQIVDFADKVHLVPFGEYLPLPFLFEYLDGLTSESGRFAEGTRHKSLAVNDQALGVFVCFESVFPEITRTLTREGATVLVNTTNDAWFGRSAAPFQHFAMAAVRAVETGRPVIRAANTGISGMISARGEVLAATDLFATTTLDLDVSPRTETTTYVRFGDALVALGACFLLLAWWRQRMAQRQA